MKTKNLLTKTLLLAAVMLGGVNQMWAAAGDPTNMPTTTGTSVTLEKSKATSDGVNNTTETTGEYGSISNGNSLLFKLENSVAQQYTISYLAGTSNSNNSVKVQILSSADAATADYEGTINLYNSGSWGNWCQYAFTTSGNVTTGTKYLKLIFQGSGYICNAKNITITAGTKPNSSTLVEIPAAENAAYTFTLDEKVTYTSNTGTGSDVPNKKTSGTTPYYDNYGGSGMVTYAIYNNTNQYYRISFHGATENATSSFTFIVLDATGNVEATSTFSISTTSWTTFNETTLKSFTTSSALTTGHKTFILKFQNVNVANLTFTPAEAATQYTVTTSSNPAIGGTVFGAGTYDSGSDVNVTQKAKWGYQFSSWTVNETAAGSESSYTISSIAANTNIVGNFSIYDGIFQSIPTAAESYLDLTLANPDLAINGKPTASYLDNYRSNEQTQFALRSSSDQKFNVSFKASRNDAENHSSTTVTFTFATKAAPENIVCTKVVTVEHSGSWTDFNNTYNFATEELAAGDWIMTLTFGNTGTTCNIKDIAVTGAVVVALNESTNYTPVEKYANVTLTRTINAGNWSTIVLPFDMTAEQVTTTFGEGTKLAGIKDYTSNTLNTEELTTITANVPCFIKVANNFSSATISGVTIKTGTPEKVIDGDFKFAGVYTAGKIADGNYFLKDNQMYKSTGKSNIKPFRAYFTGVPSDAKARLAFFDDETTGINAMDNEQLTIDNNAPIFNLAGQRVSKNYKGVVIQNGKKYIQK